MTNLTRLDRLYGAITDDIGRTLYGMAKKVSGDHAIVEIGSYLGKSTCYLAAGCRDDVGVYAVDPWETIPPSDNWRQTKQPVPTFKRFLEQVSSVGLSEKITPLQGRSTDIAPTYDGPPVGLLYIDGDHRAGAAEADFRAWHEHLTPGAVVVFDDYSVTRNPEVAKDVARIKRFFERPIETINNGRIAVARVP